MADNTLVRSVQPVTPPTDYENVQYVVASDDVGGVAFQRVKLDIGGDGVSSPVVVGNPLPITGTVSVDTSALATSAKQDTGNGSLATIAGKDFATQTTLAALLAKIIAAPATEAKQDVTHTRLGDVTEAAPGTDTASSGLNGRLQRIAQRLSSLIALLPTALGAGGGLKVDGSGTALPVSGTIAVSGTVTMSLPTTVTHTATTLTNANTEYTLTVPANTRRLSFKCRTSYVMRFAWVTGKVASAVDPYQTLPAGAEYSTGDVLLGASTLYLASAQAGVVVEAEMWS